MELLYAQRFHRQQQYRKLNNEDEEDGVKKPLIKG